ncbi:hypothetical protein V8B97DRAFT_1974437 [Scleroderma yunnanense]
MARKKRAEEEEEEEEEVYHVKVITKARVGEDGDWEYLVKWAGYDSDADSWEPADNVKQCDRLLGSFWRHIGTDDDDYAVGYVVSAGDEWIKKEKKYFAETFLKPAQKKAEKDGRKKNRKLPVPASINDIDLSESSDDVALAKELSKKRKVVRTKPNTGSEAPTPRPHPVTQLKKPNPLQSSSSNTWKSLSFRKSKPSVPIIQAKDYTKQPDLITPPPPLPSPPPPPNANGIETAGPSENLFDSFSAQEASNFEPPTAHFPEKPIEEIMAEQFLKTVNIAALHAPVEPEGTPMVIDAPSVVSSKPAPARIPKKWKWSGDLFITCSDKTELLCNVTIKEPSSSGDSSAISVLMSQMGSLRISKLYLASELAPVFRAHRKQQYFAQLESTEDHEEVLIQGLKHHMVSQQQVAIIPLLLDHTEVAILVLFPAIFTGLTNFLQIPRGQVPDNSLLVVLLPSSISSNSFSEMGERAVCDIQHSSSPPGKPHWLHRRPLIYQAIFFLGFPSSLLEFFDNPSRTYGIWFSSSDCGQSTSGLETALLQLILGATRATVSNLKDEVRVIFIHVGALPTIRALPSLVAKLSQTPETQFFTYGTHPSVESWRWGVHEIFPLGGLVTFTATVLAEDPIGCYQMMARVAEHPVWECFVTPNVLAASSLLAVESNSSSDPFLQPILELIDTGNVSLIRLPGSDMASKLQWVSSFLKEYTLSGSELLEVCTANLRTRIGDLPIPQLQSMINDELITDMAKVQLQPQIMDHHRRFVIIRAASEVSIAADKDGFEWCSLTSFDFKDDFED